MAEALVELLRELQGALRPGTGCRAPESSTHVFALAANDQGAQPLAALSGLM